MTKKNKLVKPDEYFSTGTFEMARFGENILLQNNFTDEEHKKIQQDLIEQFPDVVEKIDGIILEIVNLVITLPPEKLLQRVWLNMAGKHMGKVSESEAEYDDIVSLRMLEYVQSVIVATKPLGKPKDDVTEDDLKDLHSLIENLFSQLNLDYQFCRTAIQGKENPDFDIEYETFYYKSQMYWCNIRGNRYMYHEEEHFKELISPHSDVLDRLFGITSEQLIEEILKIQHSLTKGIIEAGLDLKEFHREVINAVEIRSKDKENISCVNIHELSVEVIRDNGWEDRKKDVFGRFLGLDLFDLEKATKIPKALLDKLSWEQGGEEEFFADGEFKGWPLRILPIFKRPFVKLNGRYYCFILHSFLDKFYRILQKIVVSIEESYRTEWNQKQKDISEYLPFKYLQKLLPNAQVYSSIYYRWHTGDVNKKQWCEADGLIIYDDHLFIIEVKAGAFTYTSPATDFPAYIESIRNLVLKPAIQGKRFVDYLKSNRTVAIFDKEHCEIDQLSSSDFRQITICPITLDTFTELAAQAQHLKPLGVDVGDFPVWSISIDDLRVCSDIFVNPLVFLHFVEQRMKAFKSDIIQTDDELDHLGLYIKHKDYVQHAENIQNSSNAKIIFNGYRSEIDKYFSEKIHKPNTSFPLEEQIPNRIDEIIDILSNYDKTGRSKVASYLLDRSDNCRNEISDNIEEALRIQQVLGRVQPLSTYGDTKLTIFCWQKSFLPREQELAAEHSKASMLTANDKERLLIELVYTNDRKLESIYWTDFKLEDIPNSDMQHLMNISASIKKNRFEKAGKIGRNSPCLCGSGKKYKKCCLQSK